MSSEKLKPVLIALKIWEIEHHAFVLVYLLFSFL